MTSSARSFIDIFIEFNESVLVEIELFLFFGRKFLSVELQSQWGMTLPTTILKVDLDAAILFDSFSLAAVGSLSL